MKDVTIAIDAMGGDHGLKVVIPACLNAIRKHPNLKLLLVGISDHIHHHLKNHDMQPNDRLVIIHAPQQVGMDELPSHALRNKKKSSMREAINLVKNKEADACVSAGNTGALVATARFVLKTLPGIDRPAIIAEMPVPTGKKTRVIDLGANVDSCAEHLFQFAVMGTALIQAVDKKERPTIGLLNIGVEEIKGNDQIKQTAHLLASCQWLNYVGYVEGNAFYSGEVDLVVCDGFAGNAMLKASEGLAHLVANVLKESFAQNWLYKCAGFLALPALKHMKKRLDPGRYNGASMLGLNGIVVKSHGGADSLAFESAIEKAMLQVKSNMVDLVRDQINDFINQGLL